MNGCMRVSREHLHTVFTDRINVPRMDPIDGTLKLHMVSGTSEHGERLIVVLVGEDMTTTNVMTKTYKLKLASMPCACKACRGEAGHQETCIFKGIRNEREAWVHATLQNEKKPAISTEDKETFKLIYLQFTERLKIVLAGANMLGEDGSAKITVKIMKDFLRLHSQITSGRKHELAKRIVDLHELGIERPMQGPLAATYNIEGDDDLDAGGDDDSEIDA
jgi:hypothetical protein